MSLIDIIKSLSISPRFIWKKKYQGQATVSKVKQRNQGGRNYAAGRDVNVYEGRRPENRPLPFAYFNAGVASNGVNMNLVAGQAHNLSDEHLFLESVEILGTAYPMRSRLIKAGDEVRIHQIGPLPMLDNDDPVHIDMIYSDTKGNRFLARHATELQHMAIEKYKIIQIIRPTKIEAIG